MASNVSKMRLWTGRLISAVPMAMLLMSAAAKLSLADNAVKGFAEFGYSRNIIRPLGIIELACVLIYLFPRTSVLGAILVTGYFGGAINTHVRAGQWLWVFPLLLGILAWLGLLLREPRLQPLLPLRRQRQ